ncbi:hypothetical protein CMI48_03170, partial [Candidatus Pacearchaeota archaeon]|nr:hypothetical protein [Candidatus Pacearchaeota archaeon]
DFETILQELKSKDEVSEEEENLLSTKPQIVVFNGKEEEVGEALLSKTKNLQLPHLIIDLSKGLSEEDLQEILGKQTADFKTILS